MSIGIQIGIKFLLPSYYLLCFREGLAKVTICYLISKRIEQKLSRRCNVYLMRYHLTSCIKMNSFYTVKYFRGGINIPRQALFQFFNERLL